MQIINIQTSVLKPYDKNAKKHSKEQIGAVAESIKQFGFVQPVVIDKDKTIVIGHCRVLAAKRLKMAEVPCVLVDELTPEQVNALRLVDNKSMKAVHVKVVTEASIVYLMGIVSQREADATIQVARTTSGVRKVVSLLEVLPDSTIQELDRRTQPEQHYSGPQ